MTSFLQCGKKSYSKRDAIHGNAMIGWFTRNHEQLLTKECKGKKIDYISSSMKILELYGTSHFNKWGLLF